MFSQEAGNRGSCPPWSTFHSLLTVCGSTDGFSKERRRKEVLECNGLSGGVLERACGSSQNLNKKRKRKAIKEFCASFIVHQLSL